jgi:hypothetical protein
LNPEVLRVAVLGMATLGVAYGIVRGRERFGAASDRLDVLERPLSRSDAISILGETIVLYRRFASLTAPVLAAAAVAVPVADAGAPAGLKSVTISGTAYEFANVDTMLSGATIHILEDPAARAIVAADGSYSIRVKNHARVTPYITGRGYGTIYPANVHHGRREPHERQLPDPDNRRHAGA